jgi:hypothetical protein
MFIDSRTSSNTSPVGAECSAIALLRSLENVGTPQPINIRLLWSPKQEYLPSTKNQVQSTSYLGNIAASVSNESCTAL